jgi:hypothetical protein
MRPEMGPEMVNLSQNGLHQLWDMKEKEIFFKKNHGVFLLNYSDITTSSGQSVGGVFYYDKGS